MQKISLFVLALLLATLQVKATSITGAISTNTTWTKANSPYIITGNTAVDEGVTLTIEPGVIVKVNGWQTLYVEGRIIADGNATENVVFTSDIASSPGAWNGIEFREQAVNDSSRFRYCTFEFCSNAIYLYSSFVEISNCSFKYNDKAIKTWHEMKKKALITGNDFNHNKYGIFNATKVGGIISNNSFTYNDNAIYITQGIPGSITNNKIHFNTEGIYMTAGQWMPLITRNEILSNTNHGVQILGSSLTDSMSFNIIANNGIGITLSDINTGKICHNTITGNSKGIEFSNWIKKGNVVIEYNCISNNAICNFANNCPDNFPLANNYWGSASTASISSTLIDFYDDVTKGKALYLPFLSTEDTACKAVVLPTYTPKLANTKAAVSVYPNPATNTLTLATDRIGNNSMFVITDMVGKTVYTTKANAAKQTVDVSQWAPGIYLVKYSDGTDLQVTKIVKE